MAGIIPNEIIEQVAAANDIVEVIGSYFPLKRMGSMFKALCPFHQERSPSFSVNPQRQIFKCIGCGAGGSVFRFVMDYEHIEFPAAVRKLAEKAGIQIPETQMSQGDYERLDLRRRLLGLHKAKRALIDKKQAIVCEGQIDLITAFENGVQNVIAPQGTAFTDRQARILKRYVDEVVLCFDSDAAGEKAAERSLPQLLNESLLVRIAEMPPGEDPDSLIQKQGGEAFAAQIAKSRDFFDFQIERQARKPEFATPRGKVTAARKLAEFISLIPDAVTREAVVNNAATRLEIGTPELRAMLGKKPVFSHPDEDATLDARLSEPILLDEARQWLLLLALHHPVSRMWLQAQGWERVLDDATPGSALLAKVLAADFRADDTASVNSFTATLPAEEEAALAPILSRPLPEESRVIAEDCWHELERRDITKRRQAIEARIRTPGLSIDEQTRLHLQIIEIHQEAARLPASRPPKLAM